MIFDTSKLQRYQQLAKLLIKYGRRDFIEAAGAELDAPLDQSAADSTDMPSPEELTGDLAKLGPTFVKLAQMLSTRGDLLSQPFLDALSRLQDDAAPFDYETVEQIVSAELGGRLSKIFAHFEKTPIAAASLGQVHRARLRDGREVAVKVQRPKITEQIIEDLEIFDAIAGAVDRRTELGRQFQFAGIVEQFRKALMLELDYRQEGRNLEFFAEQLEGFESIVVPKPVLDLTTERVLTMDFINGRSVAQISGLARAELSLQPLVEELCNAYLHQVLVAGCFHCDPHPGNLLITDDGRIALIDLGMVAYVDPQLRTQLLRLLLALCDGRGTETAELGIELSELQPGANVKRLIEEVSDLVARRRNRAGSGRKLGRTLLELARIFVMNGARPPPEIGLLGKTLLTLDEVAHELNPEFDPDEAFNLYAESVMRKHALAQLNPSQAFSKLLDVHGFAEKLPRRIASVLDSLASGELRVKVHALDEDRLLSALEKIGNRIALGLVLAALIVGAALVMQVKTNLMLFGYPALAIVLFMTAVVFGFAMVLGILLAIGVDFHDDERIQRSNELTPSLRVLFGKVVKISLTIIAVVAAMSAIGVDLTAFTVFSGAVGVGVGFGLQKVVSNFFSGIIILLDRSIKPGDTISLGETFGWIRELRARFVSVVTRDGREFLIPNEDFITTQVINWSFSNDLVRLDVPFGVSYDSNPHVVSALAIEAAATVERVDMAQQPVCWLTGFGDSSLDFVLRFWIRDPQNGLTNIRGKVLLALWDSFQEHGIEIPYPHRDVLLRTPPADRAARGDTTSTDSRE